MSKPLDRVAQAITSAQKIDALADAARTVAGLRTRARAARARAAKVGPVRRAFWVWRANILAEKADRLAAARGLSTSHEVTP